MYFKVSADWMKACGKGDKATVFKVLRSYTLRNLTFVDLEDNGHVWVVCASWRGDFI